MKIAFVPNKIISHYSGDGLNVSGGQIVSVNAAKAEQLLTDLPDNWELKGDDEETKAVAKKVKANLVQIKADRKAATEAEEKKLAKNAPQNKSSMIG